MHGIPNLKMSYAGRKTEARSLLKKMAKALGPLGFRRFRKIEKGDFYLHHVSLYVRPSVHIGQLGSHWRDFHEI